MHGELSRAPSRCACMAVARRELLTRDAVGETRVVLDPRARARLPAGAHGVERDRVEALRCAVDRGSQARRPAADDDEVEQVARRRVERQTQMRGELARRRSAQHRVRGDDDGGVARAEPHAREQHVHVVRVLEVDPLVHEAAATRERAEGHRLARVPRPDDPDRRAPRTGTQPVATVDQRPEDHVGEVGLGAHEAAEFRRGDDDHPSGPRHTGGKEESLPGEQVQLAEEPPGAVRHDDGLADGIGAHDLDLAVEDDHEVVRGVTGAEQDFAVLHRALGAELPELVEVGGAEHGGTDVTERGALDSVVVRHRSHAIGGLVLAPRRRRCICGDRGCHRQAQAGDLHPGAAGHRARTGDGAGAAPRRRSRTGSRRCLRS